jgi:hypothetical protein
MKIIFKVLLLTLAVIILAGSLQPPEKALAKDVKAENATVNKPSAPLFPKTLDLGDSVLKMYEPQIISHEGYTQVTVWVAAVNESKSDSSRTVGALKITADMVVDFEKRTATLYNRQLDKTWFSELDETGQEALVNKIKSLAKNEPEVMPLDTVLAYIAQADAAKGGTANLSMEPPVIFYSAEPAFLLQFNGKPVFKPIDFAHRVGYAVNTNWDVILFKKRYFLLLGSQWISADRLEGPWQPSTAPVTVSELPDSDRFERVRKAIPGKTISESDIPHIYMATKPAELILTNGQPETEMIAGTSLSFIINTSSDIIFQPLTKTYFLLLSGRWFQAKELAGPWSAVENLPAGFSKIPDDHPRAHVRAAIPGTDEAKMSVVEAHIPTTAGVSRNTRAPKVQYSGAPVFEIIKGTKEDSVERAVNTPYDVLRVMGRYYLCHQAVWFESDKPDGPWIVADRIPGAIYTIPADSPAYRMTFVKIYDQDAARVMMGYTGGYQNVYATNTTVVYGTGYYWSPYWVYYPMHSSWYWYNDYYYWYYPYPYSYGSGSFYNPVTGTYRHGDYTYGPDGGCWHGESYNERSGRTSDSHYHWDYNSGEYNSNAYNPRRGTTFDTKQEYRYDNPNSYESWGDSTITKGDDWVKTSRYANQDGRAFGYETSSGGKGGSVVKDGNRLRAGKTGDGDLYVGGNGNVYRREEDGNWQKRDNGKWNSVDTSKLDAAKERGSNLSNSQREASRQRVQSYKDTGSRNQSIDRRSSRQLNQSHQARKFGNQQFNRGRAGGRSFSGGGFSRGGRGGGRR